TRLHKEIVDFTEYLWPRQVEHTVRQHVIHRVTKALQFRFPDVDIRCFGSYASGLFLPSSDLDLVLLSRNYMATGYPSYGLSANSLHRVAHTLKAAGIIKPGSLVVIAKARVPIIKFTDYETDLHVDISFENTSGVRAIDTMKRWKAEYPAMIFLTYLLKQYLSMRNLSEVYEGGLGGFAVICLVVGMLKLVPEFASGAVDPRANLGIALMEFLDLYGNKMNTTEVGLDPAKGKFVRKPPPPSRNEKGFNTYKAHLLHVIDPNDPDNDLTRSSHNIVTIQQGFSKAFRDLQMEMERVSKLSFQERKGVSLLKLLVGGDYREMTARRNRLQLACQKIVPKNFFAPNPPPRPPPNPARKLPPLKLPPPQSPPPEPHHPQSNSTPPPTQSSSPTVPPSAKPT
ncbi:Nucleotidyltransferase, partial [Ascobolus immersus RN42]